MVDVLWWCQGRETRRAQGIDMRGRDPCHEEVDGRVVWVSRFKVSLSSAYVQEAIYIYMDEVESSSGIGYSTRRTSSNRQEDRVYSHI